MALKDSVLNIVIRAKDLAGNTLKKFRTELDKTDKSAEKARSGLSRATGAIVGLVSAAAGFAAVKSGIQAVLTTGDKFEKMAIQLEAVMGSIEGGQRATEWITEFTKSTPLQLEQTTDAFVKLKAFGLDPMDGTMQAIVDQAEKLGGGQEKLIGITNALGQAWAKQKLQGEEILQLVERGVPVYDLLAKVTGKNGVELQKMQEQGELTRDVIAAMVQEMGKAADGAAAANMTTLTGIVSNLKDTWTLWLDEVAKSGALDYFKGELVNLQNAIKAYAADGSLQEWARSASTAIVSTFEAIKGFATTLYDARGAIKLFGAAWLGLKISSWANNALALGRAFIGTVTPGISGAARATLVLGKAMTGLAWTALLGAIIDVTQAYGELKEAKRDLANSQDRLNEVEAEAAERIAQFREETGLAAETLDDLIKAQDAGLAVWDAANGKWITGADAIEKFRASSESAQEAVGDMADTLQNEIPAAAQKGVAAFEELEGAGKGTEKALDGLFKEYDLTVTDDVVAVLAALAELQGQAKLTAEEIEVGLAGALQGLAEDELQAFAINAQYAFDSGRIGAEDLAATLNDTVSEALRRLGVDIELVETGISKLGGDAIEQFRIVAENIAKSGDAADLAGDKIVQAYAAAFKKVKTEAGQAQLLEELQQQLNAGTIDAIQYQEALKLVGDQVDADSLKVQSLTANIQRLRDEMRNAGDEGQQIGAGVQEGASQASSGMSLIMGAISHYRQELGSMSEAARNAFESTALGMKHPQDQAEILQDRIKGIEQELGHLEHRGLALADTSGLQNYLTSLKINAREVEQAFLEQKLSAQQLFEAYQNGEIRMDLFIQKAQQMIRNNELLDDQDLGNLTRGIEEAERAMARLEDQGNRTLVTLQNELDRLKGDTEAILLRRFEQRQADLEAQLEQARYFKNAEQIAQLEEALRINKQIYDLEKQKAAEEAAARAERERDRQAREAERAKESEKSRQDSTGSSQQTSQHQVIELRAGGESVQVSTEDPNALLDLLASMGLKTG